MSPAILTRQTYITFPVQVRGLPAHARHAMLFSASAMFAFGHRLLRCLPSAEIRFTPRLCKPDGLHRLFRPVVSVSPRPPGSSGHRLPRCLPPAEIRFTPRPCKPDGLHRLFRPVVSVSPRPPGSSDGTEQCKSICIALGFCVFLQYYF